MEFGTEEALLILLYKFTFPTRNIQLVQMFGRDHTFIGRVFNWMNKYIREQHGHLVTNNLGYWKDSLETFTEAISLKKYLRNQMDRSIMRKVIIEYVHLLMIL